MYLLGARASRASGAVFIVVHTSFLAFFSVVHMWRFLGRNHPAGGLRDNSGSVRRHLPEEKSVADITPEAARTAPFAKPALLQTWRIFLLIFVVISVFVLDGSWRQVYNRVEKEGVPEPVRTTGTMLLAGMGC